MAFIFRPYLLPKDMQRRLDFFLVHYVVHLSFTYDQIRLSGIFPKNWKILKIKDLFFLLTLINYRRLPI